MTAAMDKDSFAFVVYIIHACAHRWGRAPAEVYDLLDRAGGIGGFLVPHYDVLHTQSTDYVVDDVSEYLANRGTKAVPDRGGMRPLSGPA